jgi:hypothetical protein
MNSVRKQWKDCRLLTAALLQVKSTLRELHLGVDLYSDACPDEVDSVIIRPIKGQLGPLRELSCLRKLKAPIVMLLGWSPDELLLPLEEVVPVGLTHLGLTEDLAPQCNYEWNEELVLEVIAVFLSVLDCVVPDLQVMEFWLNQVDNRWEEAKVAQLRVMCKEAGVLCIIHWDMEPMTSSLTTFLPWMRQGPQPTPWRLSNRPIIYPETKYTPNKKLVWDSQNQNHDGNLTPYSGAIIE